MSVIFMGGIFLNLIFAFNIHSTHIYPSFPKVPGIGLVIKDENRHSPRT